MPSARLWFVAGGAELPLVWCILLLLQALLGGGPYTLRRTKSSRPEKSLERAREE